MRELGRIIATKTKAGDLIVLSGPLGAGKTALTQGIGAALGIAGITSPTFVISRVHKGSVPLIHVDAYRLLGSAKSTFEFDDLDLDTGRESALTVIEWGGEVGARFGEDFLEIVIEFGASEDEREVKGIPHGKRWEGFTL
ncbi:MAG: tRNA (adenosine(37)-N6)-threonylcarbamoyltransferase complex ATPase subunit type 1 TsaE [Candidatus Nanopelagicaceae bacterium]|nr:tRNA (adenosine(37)-N6)-threonylcarbamoyltransferase complex ATPase subunit type 1 TsaE [Candidatus Nanopelagicaceae bacterium]